MQSAFSGIELGKRGILAHTRALETVGHNLSNASTKGYSRQRVELQAVQPIYRPQLNRADTPGQIGQGVDIARVERVRNGLLEKRIIAASGDSAYWQTRDKYILQLEQVYNEPSDSSVRSQLDKFWDSWQELSLYPEQRAAREAVLQRGQAFIESVQLRFHGLDRIRRMAEEEILATVEQINTLIHDIAALNNEIVNSKAAGDNPNDLLDRRDLLVEQLAEHIDITIDDRDTDEFSVHTAGFHIIQGRISRPFAVEPNPDNEGYSRITWEHSGETAVFRGGSLGALTELRDSDIRTEIQALNTLTVNVSDLVNEIHRDGWGLNGRTGENFFVEYPVILNAQGNYDRDSDGVFDSSYIFRVHGSNTLNAQAQIGLAGTIRVPASLRITEDGILDISYFADDTVSDVIERINNAGADVIARLNRNGNLEIKATAATDLGQPDFVIRYLEDSGQFLTGYAGLLAESGTAGAFNWEEVNVVLSLRGEAGGSSAEFSVAPLQQPSAWMAVNDSLVHDALSIASAFAAGGSAGESGDGSAALAIASLRNTTVGIGRLGTMDDYFANTVARIGLKGEEAKIALSTSEQIEKDLTDLRESISGVNIDEELAQLIKFQHGYQAAARFITYVDRMLETIINGMGV